MHSTKMTQKTNIMTDSQNPSQCGEQRVGNHGLDDSERKHFLQRVLDVTPGIVYVFDIDNQSSVFFNRNIAAVLDYADEEIDAMGSEVVPTLMHPEDLSRFAEHVTRVRAMRDEEIADFEYRMRDRSGKWHSFHSRDAVFKRGDDGAVKQVIGTSIEITEVKQAEQQVIQSEANLRDFVENASIAMHWVGPDGIILWANQTELDLLGYTREDYIGHHIAKFHADADVIDDILTRLTAGESLNETNARLRCKDGSIRDVLINSNALFEDGKFVHTRCFTRDITDRKLRDIERLQNSDVFARLIEQAPTGVYVVDSDFRMQQINALAAPVFNSTQPLIGRDFDEVNKLLWGPEVSAQVSAIFRHTLATGERYVSPTFMERRHDLDEDQAFEWEIQRVTLGDGKYGVVCYFNEITELQRTERALRESEERRLFATEATAVGIWEWNVLTNRIHWDPELFRIYGIEPTSDGNVDYSDWSNAVVPEELARNEEILNETIRCRGTSRRTFRILRRSDGACRHIEAVETVRTNSRGQAEWVVGTNLDITDRQQMADVLADADRRKDDFLATLAHELRNPLAPVSNALQLMRMSDNLNSETAELRSLMERQISHLIRLVDDLMEVSRISRGKIELQKTQVELSTILRSAIEICQPRIEEAGHELIVDLATDAIELNVDQVRLSQVIANLLTNSAKYMEAGGRIDLKTKLEGDEVTIVVRDTGLGIPKHQLTQVFEMFTQMEHTRQHTHGGLGIGLALAKSLVEMHGGTISAQSDGIGKGSTFIVRLPVSKSSISIPIVEQPLNDDPIRLDRKIFIVDDMRSARFVLEKLLTKMGQTVRTFDNAASCLEALKDDTPDIIISDIGMPDLDGYEFARLVRLNPMLQAVKLVALTGYGRIRDRERARKAGFDHHLVKPVSIDDVHQLLSSSCAV